MARASKTGVRGLFKDSKGRWNIDIRWHEPGTGEARRFRQRLAPGTTAATAKQRAREVLNAALAGGFEPRKKPQKRLGEFFGEYVRWCEANLPQSAHKRKSAVKRLLAALGDVPLGEVSPFAIEKLKRDRLKEGVAPATVNRDLEVLSHSYGLAASWGWVAEAQAQRVRSVPHLKEPPGRVRYLSPEEEARLLAALPGGIRPIVEAALLSGMRQSELVSLRKEAVDLAGRVITLTRTKSNQVRRVYINDALAELLVRAMATSPGPYVFTNRRGEPYTPDGVRSLFRKALALARLEDFRFHDLRHTAATRLRQAGVGLDAIAAILGHSSLAMTRRYAHLGQDTLREAMESLSPPSAGHHQDTGREARERMR